MAKVIFEAEQTTLDMFVEAACVQYGYKSTIPDPEKPGQTIPNPQTPGEFAQQVIVKFAKEVTKGYQVQKAAEAARKAAEKEAAAIVDAAKITVSIEE